MNKTEFDEMIERWSYCENYCNDSEKKTVACKERVVRFFDFYNDNKLERIEFVSPFIREDFKELKACLQYLCDIDLDAIKEN